jgi:DNA-directed RNA polymerase beta subunit
MEDAIVINKSAVDLGIFDACIYRLERIIPEKGTLCSNQEIFTDFSHLSETTSPYTFSKTEKSLN